LSTGNAQKASFKCANDCATTRGDKGFKDFKVFRVFRDFKDFKDFKVSKDFEDLRDLGAPKTFRPSF
jgi:hypothetical protein